MYRNLVTSVLFVLVFLAAACANVAKKEAQDVKEAGVPAGTPESFVTAEQAAKTALKDGDAMPAFDLPDAAGKRVSSETLLRDSNLVVVFYRGGWCPFCNIYLKKLQDRLPEIENAGGTLVAISAENPDDSLSTLEKNNLKFAVLSDRNLEYARKFNLVYQLEAETDKRYKNKGIDLVVDNDMMKPELPISATYIVNRDGKIVYSFVDPDYKKRLEPETVIDELGKISNTAPKSEGTKL